MGMWEQKKDTRENTITGDEWDAIMELWEAFPDSRKELIKKINININKQLLPLEHYSKETYELDWKPDPTITIDADLSKVELYKKGPQRTEGDQMKIGGKLFGSAGLTVEFWGYDAVDIQVNASALVSLLFSIVEGKAYFSLNSIKVSFPHTDGPLGLSFKMKDNKLHLLWAGSYVYSKDFTDDFIKMAGEEFSFDVTDEIEELRKTGTISISEE